MKILLSIWHKYSYMLSLIYENSDNLLLKKKLPVVSFNLQIKNKSSAS
jgi:hypothetical protein